MENNVFIAKCENYDQEQVTLCVRRLIDDLGGISHFIKSGETVLIKPNLLMPASPNKSITTHPSIVRAVAEMVVEAGATAVGGLGHLLEQAALSFELWTGTPAPLEVMSAAALALLADR